jgi:hypothetical protein
LPCGGNPVWLEHDIFSDLHWGVTHLDEELGAQSSPENLLNTDLAHIESDFQRMHEHLTGE